MDKRDKTMTTMQFEYRGHQIEIVRAGTSYMIVIDNHIRDNGWARLTSANAVARAIIDDLEECEERQLWREECQIHKRGSLPGS
jgi:hypothetical protein